MSILKDLFGGKDGYSPSWYMKVFHGKQLKQLVTMYGITDLQQRALWYLVQTPSDTNMMLMKQLFEVLEANGALPMCNDEGEIIKYKHDELPSKTKTAHIAIPDIEGFKPYSLSELNDRYRTGKITRDEYQRWKD
jgi:hypothetical protein